MPFHFGSNLVGGEMRFQFQSVGGYKTFLAIKVSLIYGREMCGAFLRWQEELFGSHSGRWDRFLGIRT